jgi:Zn-dependent protease with chaperone function
MTAQTQGTGVYFDGVSGAPQSVTVTLEHSALAIASPAGALARWDYPAIDALPAPADRLRLGLAGNRSTARIELRDPAFAAAIKQHVGFDSPQRRAGERRRRRLVVAWSAAGVAAMMAIGVTGMPLVAELLAPLIPYAMEIRLGEDTHRAVLAAFDEPGPWECGDEGPMERAGKAAFLKLIRRVEAEAHLPIPIRPFLVRTSEDNAFAGPGGFVYVNNAFILNSGSAEELAGVIGHELGHVVFRHSLKRYLHNLGMAYLVTMIVGDVVTGGGTLFATGTVLNTRYSRANETEADLFGVGLIARLGADIHATARMWDRRAAAEKQELGGFRATSVDSTHPDSAARAAAIRALPNVANPQPILTAEEWQALRQACSRK